MSPYADSGGQNAVAFTPLTIDMELSEPACLMTDVEEMIIEQRGSREVNFVLLEFLSFKKIILIFLNLSDFFYFLLTSSTCSTRRSWLCF